MAVGALCVFGFARTRTKQNLEHMGCWPSTCLDSIATEDVISRTIALGIDGPGASRR